MDKDPWNKATYSVLEHPEQRRGSALEHADVHTAYQRYHKGLYERFCRSRERLWNDGPPMRAVQGFGRSRRLLSKVEFSKDLSDGRAKRLPRAETRARAVGDRLEEMIQVIANLGDRMTALENNRIRSGRSRSPELWPGREEEDLVGPERYSAHDGTPQRPPGRGQGLGQPSGDPEHWNNATTVDASQQLRYQRGNQSYPRGHCQAKQEVSARAPDDRGLEHLRELERQQQESLRSLRWLFEELKGIVAGAWSGQAERAWKNSTSTSKPPVASDPMRSAWESRGPRRPMTRTCFGCGEPEHFRSRCPNMQSADTGSERPPVQDASGFIATNHRVNQVNGLYLNVKTGRKECRALIDMGSDVHRG